MILNDDVHSCTMVYKVVGHLVHAFIYADDVPWPVEAGGTGLTRRDQAADRVTPFVLYGFLLFTRICFETRGHFCAACSCLLHCCQHLPFARPPHSPLFQCNLMLVQCFADLLCNSIPITYVYTLLRLEQAKAAGSSVALPMHHAWAPAHLNIGWC